MTWRGPPKFSHLCDCVPLFSRVVRGVVIAPVEFSMYCAHRGIVPRLLGSRSGRRSSTLGFVVKLVCGWINLGFYPAIAFPVFFLAPVLGFFLFSSSWILLFSRLQFFLDVHGQTNSCWCGT